MHINILLDDVTCIIPCMYDYVATLEVLYWLFDVNTILQVGGWGSICPWAWLGLKGRFRSRFRWFVEEALARRCACLLSLSSHRY